jgi:hypothetical protein
MAFTRRFASTALLWTTLLCLGILTQPAGAQARLAADDAADDAAEQNAPATREQERQQANNKDWFRAPMRDGHEHGAADFPSGEVHDAVVAYTEAAAARAMFRRAESALAATVRLAYKAVESTPELRDAQAAEQKAYEGYLAARDEALKDVIASDKYKAMQDLRDNLAEQIADRKDAVATAFERRANERRPGERPSRVRLVSTESAAAQAQQESVMAMATLKMRVASDARVMEREALASDDKVRQARQDWLAAGAKVAALRADNERKARDNQDIKKAAQAVEDARVARVTAESYFRGADLAAGEALDFSYWIHRYDYYRYNRYYDLSPYASYYGYGYPYYFRTGVGFASRGHRAMR